MTDDFITIDEFRNVDLRVAEIVSCEKVKDADKLLRLRIGLGDEEREIVAGLAQHYAPESLVGRLIVVVCNLKPAIIRGLESKGMLLAVRDGETLSLLTVDRKVQSGSKVS